MNNNRLLLCAKFVLLVFLALLTGCRKELGFKEQKEQAKLYILFDEEIPGWVYAKLCG